MNKITNTLLQKLEAALKYISENRTSITDDEFSGAGSEKFVACSRARESEAFDLRCLEVAIADETQKVRIRRAMNLIDIEYRPKTTARLTS